MSPTLTKPFGEESCESEINVLKDSYEKYYFREVPFNEISLDKENYLFIGRRGTGKSSLAHYFTFQNRLKNALCIDVDEPHVYETVLSKISGKAADSSDVAAKRIVQIWSYVIWCLIFEKFKHLDSKIKSACFLSSDEPKPSNIIREILKNLLKKCLKDDTSELTDDLEEYLFSSAFKEAKNKTLEITKKKPVIVAIDSLERYAVQNEPMMRATAALIECSSNFNQAFSDKGIHVKTFISAEIYPHIAENEISNTSKFIRNPVSMHWRPKDLIRLVSWRFRQYLKNAGSGENGRHIHNDDEILWDKWQDVIEKAWVPYFGDRLINGNNINERTFPYLLRHTQLRPRQLIIFCNKIASLSRKKNIFPKFTPEIIVESTKKQERLLATEIINSYSKVYENAGNIVRALDGFPMMFKGNELDKAAPVTASEWPDGDYSPYKFRQVIAELGIVGKVRKHNKETGIVEADFEYFLDDRLSLNAKDMCVIHPMFFEKLNIDTSQKLIIYPFPDHPDYNFLKE